MQKLTFDCRKRKVVTEEDLDRELEEEQERKDRKFDTSEEESGEEEDYKKPSAYSLLIGSLKKTSKQKAFYRKIQLEEQGYDNEQQKLEQQQEEEMEDEDEEMEDDIEGEESESEEDEDEDEEGGDEDEEEEEEEEEVDADAADAFEEEEEEIVYVGSDEEDDEPAVGDLFESRFVEEQPASFDEKIATIEQKKWKSQVHKDETLNDVMAFTTDENITFSSSETIADLESVNVKKRIAGAWPKANKSVKKGRALLSPLQNSLFHQMNEYRDIAYCNRTLDNAKEIRNVYALHALNHVTK